MLENFREHSKPRYKLGQSLISGPNLSATYGFNLIDHRIHHGNNYKTSLFCLHKEQ